MSDTPSREEVNARLEAAEARTEARFAHLDTRFVNLDNKLDRLTDSVGRVAGEIEKVRSDNRYTRWTVIGVVVASVLAGLGALWVTQGNMLAAFQASLTVKATQSSQSK